MHLKMFVGIQLNGINSKIKKIHMVQPPKPPSVKTTLFTLQCTFNLKMPFLMPDSKNLGQYQSNDA